MTFSFKWVRKYFERHRLKPRRQSLEKELGKHFGGDIRLKVASAKGGYDEIFLALRDASPFAMVRLNNPDKRSTDPVGPNDPGIPLGARDRLDREWKAYDTLSALGFAPKPLWRCSDAIVCEWLNWNRASLYITENRNDVLPTYALMLPIIGSMHSKDIAHLDLNLGNFLLSPTLTKAVVIDFEFGPSEGVSLSQQLAFDYLKLLNDGLRPRRGGKQLLAVLPAWIELLESHVDDRARSANLDFAPHVLKRIYDYPDVVQGLRDLFPGLPPGALSGARDR
ncbi:MAG: hypothetical protein P8L18_16795 [Verrucomicrobiota bacterium]|nr:hypothetical protein [Verrucomicrobiota bacterium]